MQHTKFQGHRPFGSGEEDFLRFLPYMGMAAILVMWPGPFEQTSFPHPMETPYEIWLQLAQWFLRRRCLKSVDDGRRRPTYPISSPMSLRLRWAKNRGRPYFQGAGRDENLLIYLLLPILRELQSDFHHFCKNLTEFYQIYLKNLPYLTAFSPQLMV